MSICIICGKPTNSPRPLSKPRKTCGSPECRQALRKITGQESAKKIKAANKARAITRECLRCGLPFKAAHKFNRLCSQCKDHNRTVRPGAEYWGAVI